MPGETTAMNVSEAQQAPITALLQRAQLAGVELRSLPPQPLTCCGRGCNGCVWEGYFTALDHWCEDAAARLD